MSAPGRERLPPINHQTLAVTELHRLDSQGIPEFHAITRQILAMREMDRVPFIVDTAQENITKIDAITGCRVEEPYSTGCYQVYDLVLDRPLHPGEQTELTFSSASNYKKAPPPESLHSAGNFGMRRLDVTVLFAADKLPESVWWGRYEASSSSHPGNLNLVGQRIEVPLRRHPGPEGKGEVRHVEENLGARAIYGFRWSWGNPAR